MPAMMKDRLADDIETLRADVLKAGVLNAKALQESAELHVARLHDTAEATPALQDASFEVVTSVIAFARLLYGQAAIVEVERARRDALAAIDRLAAVLGHADAGGPAGLDGAAARAGVAGTKTSGSNRASIDALRLRAISGHS